MQYVSLLDTLKCLLKHDDIFRQVVYSRHSADDCLRDVVDGEHFKNHPFWQETPLALQIILYFDEFIAVNQAGMRAPAYKYAAFYYQLGNIEPALRSQFHCIFLAILVKNKIVKKHGLNTVMRPLIEELSVLENIGIDIVKPKGTFKFRGAPLVVADNLESHAIGGFLESFSALRSCRFCTVTRDELKKLIDISKCPEKSIASYNYQVAMVETEPTLSSTYGVKKKRSPLNVLQQFHVANALPPDILYDLFEFGLVSESLVLLIDQYVLSGYFSLQYLAGRVKEFHYKGTDKINRPEFVILRGSVHIKQKAVQGWCLLRLYPLLVGDAVPEGNHKWKVLLALLNIEEFIMCPSMSCASIEFLNDVIQQFHYLYEK
ncbi:uncharacterized protein LOC143249980 [Tachypleus tridentatus]|uniref:uncharacterized protein LOC143249980 n=1 Tax=Tachypleus tridentatus TaxID=6853 RepID=UPI003FD296EB